jgi:hypothetical protein
MAYLFAGPNSTWIFFSVGLYESKVYSRHPVDSNAIKPAILDESQHSQQNISVSYAQLLNSYVSILDSWFRAS